MVGQTSAKVDELPDAYGDSNNLALCRASHKADEGAQKLPITGLDGLYSRTRHDV